MEFTLKMVGTGPMETVLREQIESKDLGNRVRILGPKQPTEVRKLMEESQIFLFTSDRREGWGAVLNEAMNSGCAVVACDAAGATPYLVRDGYNGLIFRRGDEDALFEMVRTLLVDSGKCRTMGSRAYETVLNSWNAETAAQRFTELTQQLLDGTDSLKLYDTGPCSRA
jgi:glycosyltransferase involved in cell wall biosynthesis